MRFSLGNLIISDKVLRAMNRFDIYGEIVSYIAKHANCEWGEVSAKQAQLNSKIAENKAVGPIVSLHGAQGNIRITTREDKQHTIVTFSCEDFQM